MNKRWLMLIVVTCMITVLLLPACTAPAPAAKPITLKLGSDAAPVAFFNTAVDWWCKEIAKQTQGRVVIEQFHASSLVPPNEAIASLNGGLIDFYIISVTALAAQMPVSQVFCMPGLSFPPTQEGKVASCASYEPLIAKYPALANEWKGLKVMYANAGPTFNIISRGKEIRAPADISGVKIGALGARQDLMKLLGAAPVAAPPPQAYQMLQTGVVEAFTMPWVAVNDYQLWEVVKSQVDVDTGMSAMVNVISTNSWNKISPGDQKIMLSLASQATAKSAENLLKDEQAATKKFKDYGRTMITLTQQERAAWQEKYQAYWNEWIAKQEGRGIAGVKELFNARKSEVDAAWAKK